MRVASSAPVSMTMHSSTCGATAPSALPMTSARAFVRVVLTSLICTPLEWRDGSRRSEGRPARSTYRQATAGRAASSERVRRSFVPFHPAARVALFEPVADLAPVGQARLGTRQREVDRGELPAIHLVDPMQCRGRRLIDEFGELAEVQTWGDLIQLERASLAPGRIALKFQAFQRIPVRQEGEQIEVRMPRASGAGRILQDPERRRMQVRPPLDGQL